MRASHSSGMINILLEEGIYFDYVAGISAGSSLTVNYLSRDRERTEKSFVDFAKDPQFGGVKSFLKGDGWFNARYVYEQAGLSDGVLPFDMETFRRNPARYRIGAFERDTGKMRYWRENEIRTREELLRVVRASSTLPIMMPAPEIDGKYYVDGGLAGGVPLDIAKEDGFKKFFFILTREKGYRKTPPKGLHLLLHSKKKYPYEHEALLTRYIRYNATMEEIDRLEREGSAYVVRPEKMTVNNREMDCDRLRESYERGYRQGRKELDRWKDFLFN